MLNINLKTLGNISYFENILHRIKVDLCFDCDWLPKARRVVSSRIAASPSVIIEKRAQAFSRSYYRVETLYLPVKQSFKTWWIKSLTAPGRNFFSKLGLIWNDGSWTSVSLGLRPLDILVEHMNREMHSATRWSICGT